MMLSASREPAAAGDHPALQRFVRPNQPFSDGSLLSMPATVQRHVRRSHNSRAIVEHHDDASLTRLIQTALNSQPKVTLTVHRRR
jgi:hypothetical protein